MKKILTKIKTNKILWLLLSLIVILLVVLFLSTRAFINPVIGDEAITNINVSSCGYFTLNSTTEPINLSNSFPMTDNRGMALDPYSFSIENSCTEAKSFNIYLIVTTDSEISSDKIKVNLSSTETNIIYDLDEFTLTSDIENQFNLSTGKEIKEVYLLDTNTINPEQVQNFDFRMWLSDEAGNEVQNKSFYATITVADNPASGEIAPASLSKACKNQETAECFSTNSNLDENLIQHTTSIATSAQDDNYRYSGANPDNWVCFGTDESECPEENKYRILGIYDGKVKLVKATPIDKNGNGTGEYAPNGADTFVFDTDNSNNYATSDVNTYLNTTYYDEINSIYQDMIYETKYNVGGISTYTNIAPKAMYNEEIVTKTTDNYNFGIINPSDYFYATDQSYWGLVNYTGNLADTNDFFENEEAKSDNWLSTLGSDGFEWTMNPSGSTNDTLMHIRYTGFTSSYDSLATNSYALRPTLYLKTNVGVKSGMGTEESPFRLYQEPPRNITQAILEDNGGASVIEAKADPDFATVADTAEETGMWSMPDDYGTSYYFRGAVDNNWVHFAGYYWRIVRINGDGSVRVIYSGVDAPLESEKVGKLDSGEHDANTDTEIDTGEAFNPTYNNNAYVGYMYTVGERQGLSTSSPIKTLLENWYTTNLTSYDNIIADNLFCYDRSLATSGFQNSTYGSANGSYTGTGIGISTTLYGGAGRVTASSSTFGPGGSGPELTCPSKEDAYTKEDTEKGNGAIEQKIGLLSVDEAVASGLAPVKTTNSNYLYTNSHYWLGSPFGFASDGRASVWYVHSAGLLSSDYVYLAAAGLRPAVSISNLASVSGSGEWNDPYVVE